MKFYIDNKGNCHEQHSSNWLGNILFGLVAIAVGATLLQRIARQVQ